MRREDVLEASRVRPFKPFRIHVSDGAAYDLRHPEMVMVTRTSAVVGFPEPDNVAPAIERYSLVDLLHITRLEQIDTPTST
jgi:hypothetical protein